MNNAVLIDFFLQYRNFKLYFLPYFDCFDCVLQLCNTGRLFVYVFTATNIVRIQIGTTTM